jgi:hypothetical protein
MQVARRGFVAALAAAAGGLAVLPLAAQQQENANPGMPKRPEPGDPTRQDQNGQSLDPKASKRAIALQNEKEFRAGVAKLYEMTGSLKEEVEKMIPADVLSVRVYKKMEEIEKLAKQLKSKVRG